MGLYDDIISNNTLSREQKAEAIKQRGAEELAQIEAEKRKNMRDIWTKGAAGAALMGASMLPVFNVPYVGTGIGGAMFSAGDSIAKGEKLKDIAKNAGTGFLIGETVGAVPYVGKLASKTKTGQAVAKQTSNLFQKIAEKPIVQKAEDVLMTDIKAFNPNKQTAYHGSPYDFKKFSNDAIGTGEGAQVHGRGHYSALNKDIAEERYAKRLQKRSYYNDADFENIGNISPNTKNQLIQNGKDYTIKSLKNNLDEYKDYLAREKASGGLEPEQEADILNTIKLYENEINTANKLPDRTDSFNSQLYKLSIPKDDVMLREDLPLLEQPKAVQDTLKDIIQNQRQQAIENLNLPIDIKEKAINEFNTAMNYNSNNPMDVFHSWQRLQKLIGKENAEKLQKASFKNSLYKSDADIMGRTFYNNLGKSANDILSQRGIKGISYNGGIDGEARVIFNPEDIDIVRKYYNQPNLWQYITGKNNIGTDANILYNSIRQ